jgi:hypothetical protein
MKKIKIWDSGRKKEIWDGKNSDPGWKKSDPRFGIRDKHPGSATLLLPVLRNIILVLV